MTTITWRRPASIAAAALITSALPLLAVSAPAHADTPVTKTIDYRCDLYVGLPDIKPEDEPFGEGLLVPVGISFTVPTLRAGAAVPPTPVKIDLDLGEYDDPEDPGNRAFTVRDGAALIGGTTVSGSSSDAALEVRANGASKKYVVDGLSVKDYPVEQDFTKGWVVPVNGSSPTITLPDASTVDLLAPDVFTVDADIFGPKSDADPTLEKKAVGRLDCTGPDAAGRLLATVPITSAPKATPAMTAQVRDKVVRANSTRPQLLVRTNSKPQATGAVNVYTEDRRKIATGTLNANGDVRIVLPTFGKRGNRALVVDYVGDTNTSSTTVTARFRVS